MMDEQMRRRHIAYFERLGEQRVRLYTAIDCDRYLGDWQVRELADQWLEAKVLERQAATADWKRRLRKILSRRGQDRPAGW